MFKKKDWIQFLKDENNYVWQDIVRLSIEENISIERLIARVFTKLGKVKVKDLVNFISEQIKNTI